MFNHKDYLQSSSFQFQLIGSKRWHVCPPSENSKLYSPGKILLIVQIRLFAVMVVVVIIVVVIVVVGGHRRRGFV